MVKAPTFKHPSPAKRAPDPAALAAFAAGAEDRSTTVPPVTPNGGADLRTSGIQAPSPSLAVDTNPGTGTKKLTVFLDHPRWRGLKNLSIIEERSAQKIFVEALDDYFRKHGTMV